MAENTTPQIILGGVDYTGITGAEITRVMLPTMNVHRHPSTYTDAELAGMIAEHEHHAAQYGNEDHT